MIFEQHSKNGKILLVIAAVLLFVGILFAVRTQNESEGERVACTLEAKLCPDGSSVGRTGPNCEFSLCPIGERETSPDFPNEYIGKAITDYLVTQRHFSWKTSEGSFNICSVENLQPEKELFPLYVWAYCGEYMLQDGALITLSGSSGPVKIDYPNELSYYDISRFSYEAPGDGSQYAEDIRKIFPEDIWQDIFDFQSAGIVQRNEDTVRANILAWESVIQAVDNCQAVKAFQTHNRAVIVELKGGERLTAIEPELDDIMVLVNAAEARCGRITIGTE